MSDQLHDSEVIDISPTHCARCSAVVGLEDAYCQICGYDLLTELSIVCGQCGRALAEESVFCPTCGCELSTAEQGLPQVTHQFITEPEIEGFPSIGADSVHPAPRRVWRVAVTLAALLVLAGALAAAWWFLIRTDYKHFDAGLTAAVASATNSQEAVDDISGPSDLDAFDVEMQRVADQVSLVENEAAQTDGSDLADSLERVAAAEDRYFSEFVRLAALPSADAKPSQYRRVDELADELNVAIQDALDLRGSNFNLVPPTLSPTSLTSALADLAEYRERIIQKRSEIRKQNRERAQELENVTAFTGQLDGIIARYSDARSELQDWLDDVRTYGASLMEGYRVLDQNLQLRQQIRDELSSVVAPEDFSGDVQALLAVIDDAVSATDSAILALDEYLYSWRYRSVFETPGWAQFQSATASISDDYAAAISSYEQHKDEVIRRLSKTVPLPELPE